MADNPMYPMQPMGYQMQYPTSYAPMQYNPALYGQQRIQEIQQMYPQTGNQIQQQGQQATASTTPQPAQQPITHFSGKAVNGIEEAKQANMVFDGSVNVFTDIGSGKIYTRQLMLDGTVSTNTYALQPTQKPQDAPATSTAPAIQDDISKAIEAATSGLVTRVTQLEQQLNKYEGMISNVVQSNADNGNASKQRKPDANTTGDSRE